MHYHSPTNTISENTGNIHDHTQCQLTGKSLILFRKQLTAPTSDSQKIKIHPTTTPVALYSTFWLDISAESTRHRAVRLVRRGAARVTEVAHRVHAYEKCWSLPWDRLEDYFNNTKG